MKSIQSRWETRRTLPTERIVPTPLGDAPDVGPLSEAALRVFALRVPDGVLLDTSEVSAMLRVSRRTVCCWAEEGQLPAFKLGRSWRFRGRAIKDWIKNK
jgi:excisionase family DNA binding protein